MTKYLICPNPNCDVTRLPLALTRLPLTLTWEDDENIFYRAICENGCGRTYRVSFNKLIGKWTIPKLFMRRDDDDEVGTPVDAIIGTYEETPK